MTKLSENLNAQAAGAIPLSPVVPNRIMVVEVALTWVALGLTKGPMSRIAECLE